MYHLSKKLEYSLLILRYLNSQSEKTKISAKQFSRILGSPYDFTAKILQSLVLGGVLSSRQGQQGGYFIDCDLSQMNFYTFSQIFAEGKDIVDCLEGKDCSLLNHCGIISSVLFLREKIKNTFTEISLCEVLNEQNFTSQKSK